MQPKSWQVGIVLSIGVVAVSTAAILIRLAMAAAATNSVGFSLFIAASRLIISAVILIPAWQNFKKHQVTTKALIFAIAKYERTSRCWNLFGFTFCNLDYFFSFYFNRCFYRFSNY
ncbi:hypothetical protein [Stanieria cyanosphaera]|uniref:hypothetical protein n=1 Tax=Stanieria cyanosphaera TaxID=102116 RepID=UPI00030C84B5|nr:hypothetical protein [Stanieria cyanosphaera]